MRKTIRSADATPGMSITSREGVELTVESVTGLPNGTRPSSSRVLLTVSAQGLSGCFVRDNSAPLTVTI
ncbi:Uncharacterised protein [Mycobacteroides abscessus subsp. massiliense]|nr:Uncharacterised protein [Mycobacteroides abscessus subsp. abscessus]SKQ82161.1 Uncharacterised protein [Mycobacteroides abscessus subsp. massiliense]SLC50666.1 Uncharacterised protein [Mycobacteroides abscessus subsp. massiliense]